ncbi:MAG: SH3 domain-containing protein [Clostridiales bacterium]|nr:SH3 domain-containing protein [Clostridiales bacterium]
MTNSMRTQPVRRLLRRGLSVALAVMLILTAMPAAFAAPGELVSVSATPGSVTLTLGGGSATITADLEYEPEDLDPETPSPVAAQLSAGSSTGAVHVERISGTNKFTLTANSVGSDTITVTAQQGSIVRTATVSVTVNAPPVLPEGVNFTPSAAEIIIPYNKVSEIASVDYAVYPSDVDPDHDSVQFASSNPAVVEVTPAGSDDRSGTITLTGYQAGSATITATTGNGKSAVLPVTVSKQIPAESLLLSSTSATMAVGQTRVISADILPTNFNYPASIALSATVAPGAIVDVDVDQTTRKVTLEALAKGSATVTVTAAGLPAQTISVLVTNVIPATGIWVGSDNVKMKPSSPPPATPVTCEIPVGISPSDFNSPDPATIKLSATSSDASVVQAQVDMAVTPWVVKLTSGAKGSTTVTVTVDGLPQKTINVVVSDDSVAATGIWVGSDNVKMKPSSPSPATPVTCEIPVGILPSDFNFPNPINLNATSSDTSVVQAQVDKTATPWVVKLTSGVEGSTTVTLSSDGLPQKIINVVVSSDFVAATGITFLPNPVTITIPRDEDSGYGYVLCNLTGPAGMNDSIDSVASSDESIVYADLYYGVVDLEAFEEGTTTVTVLTEGGLMASFEVTVIRQPGEPEAVVPNDIESAEPVVHVFRRDTASVVFEVYGMALMQGAQISVASKTGNTVPVINYVVGGGYIQGDGGDEYGEPALVYVNVLGLKAGADIVELTVNGVVGSVPVNVYDKIFQADVNIEPPSKKIQSGDSATFQLAGLDGLSTYGYTFEWEVGTTDPANSAWINGNAAGTSVEVGTSATWYGSVPITLTVTPPDDTIINGSEEIPDFTLSALLEAHREGELMLSMNSTLIEPLRHFLVGGDAKQIPKHATDATDPANAFILKCWKDGVLKNVSTAQFVYTSSNPSVIDVDDNGYLTPLATGSATITVAGVDYTNPDKAPASSSFDVVVHVLTAPSQMDIKTGELLTLPAKFDPTGGYIAYRIVPSVSSSTATVNEGVFYAAVAGVYRVEACAYLTYEKFLADPSTEHNLAFARKTITINAKSDPKWIMMNDTAIDIPLGEQWSDDPAVPPYDELTHGVITGLVSANPSALGVDGDVVTGLAVCTSQYVYATTSNGYRLYFKFNVTSKPVTGIEIVEEGKSTAGDAKMLVGEIREYDAVLTPQDHDDATVIWSTGDSSIAEVDQNGSVTAKKAGVTTLNAALPDGLSDTILLTVVEQPSGIVLSNTYLEGYPGASIPLTYQVLPEGVEYDSVQWQFTPTINGAKWIAGLLVLPADAIPGDYVITAELFGPGYNDQGELVGSVSLGTDECLLRVLRPVTEVELANVLGQPYADSVNINGIVGTSIIVRANISPDTAADKRLLWDVEDDNIAIVEPITPFGAYARVTFVGKGETNLIVKSASSEASDQILLKVVKAVTDFTLTPNYKELYPGESFTYGVTLVPEDTMLLDNIAFTSGDTNTATVHPSYGTVTAVAPSDTPVVISAKYNNGLHDTTRTATVLVKNPVKALEFYVTGTLNLTVGESYDLYSKLNFIGMDTGMDVADRKVTWGIEKGQVVSIDPNGIARADMVGDSWVYAYAHSGVFAKLLISVKQNTQGLTLDAYDIAIRPNEVATIHATVLPVESTDVLEWELEPAQTNVAITNSDSRSFSVRGANPGVTTLTATTSDAVTGDETARKVCTITVKQPAVSVEIDSVSPVAAGAFPTKTVTATHVGQSIQLFATVKPTDAYDKSVTWSVPDSSVASIDQNGVLTANNVGTTVAIARSNSDPDVYGMINVVVVRGLLSLSVDPDEKAIYVGDRFTITPSLLPEGSAMPPVTYEATSADPTMPVSLTTSVASGVTLCKVTGMAAGKATITAYIFKGTADEVSATCRVEVLVPLTTFTVKKDRIRMLVGDAFRYDLADDLLFNNPADPATQPKDKTVVYTSADPLTASVDSYGQITAKKVGTTIINIVPNANPNLRAQVTVEVVDLAAGVVADAAEIRVYPGQKIPVNFTFVPEAIATTAFDWAYFDEEGHDFPNGDDIAYFKDGFVYTVAPGFVNLVATVEIPPDIQNLYSKYPSLKFKEVKTSILVTVLTPVESVIIDSLDGVAKDPGELETLTYHVGERFVLGASVTPDGASDPEIYWSTSDTNIATVDAFGIVSATGTGTAKVYATSKNSGVQDSLTLVVEKAPYAVRYGATTVSGLFVRYKPSLQGKVYTQFKKNTKVTIVGEYGEWYEILYSKSTTGLAYVHKLYIRVTGFADPKPLVNPGELLTESNATISAKTTVWANPGSGYRTTAPAGTRIMVVGSSGSYYAITYGHYNLGTGYVLASRVTKDADFPKGKIIKDVPNGTGGYDSFLIDPGTGAAVPLVGETQVVNIPSSVTATSAPVYSGFDPATRVLLGRVYKGVSLTIISEKLNGFYQVRLSSGIVGWVEAIYLAQPASGGIETKVSVTILVGRATTNVNIRRSASTSSSRIGSLKKNQTIQLVSTTKYNGFYKVVNSSGATGYIMAKYLKVSTQVKEQITITPVYDQYGYVNCKLLNVRETGAMDGVITGTLLANQQVKILDEVNGWYHVERADGSLGFVKTEFITLIES